jgi:hypothetical protein
MRSPDAWPGGHKTPMSRTPDFAAYFNAFSARRHILLSVAAASQRPEICEKVTIANSFR